MKKQNIYNTYLDLIMINSLISVTYRLHNNVFSIGRVIGFLQIIVLLMIYEKSLKKQDLLFLLFIFCIDIFSLIKLSNYSIDFENIIFFTSTTLLLWKFSEPAIRKNLYDAFKYKEAFYFEFALFLIFMILFSFFFNFSWVYSHGEKIFTSTADTVHKLAGNICLLSSIFLIYFIDKKIEFKNLILFIVCFLLILSTGSRTYFISFSVILLILYLKKLKNYKFVKIILPILLIFMIFFILNSSFFRRFEIMGNNKYISDNYLEAASSGRLIWWKIDMENYFHFNLKDKLIGKGFTYLYDLNLKEYGLSISAHNDFLTLLISTGLFGFVGYILIIIKWFFKRNYDYSFPSKFTVFLSVLMFAFNAMITGFYGAQQYLFCNLFISLVLYYVTNDERSNEIEK